MDYALFKDILELLLVIFGLISAGASVGIYKIISWRVQKDAENKSKETIKVETIKMYRSMGYMYWKLYEKQKDEVFLQEAIELTSYSLKQCKEISKKRYEELIVNVKNNLGFYISQLENPSSEEISTADFCAKHIKSSTSKYYDYNHERSKTLQSIKKMAEDSQ